MIPNHRPHARAVQIPVNHAAIDGDLSLPVEPLGLVIFAHGSGSGRLSPRNQQVAERLRRAQFGTLLVDLLTVDEQQLDRMGGDHRFDVELLAKRLLKAVDFAAEEPRTCDLPVALYGASTGAAAALAAAATQPESVQVVISRGGRPDLAEAWLSHVQAPTLFVVGGADAEVLSLHRPLLPKMRAPAQLQLVPGAGHLFEGPGELEAVSALVVAWLRAYLPLAGNVS